MIVSHTRLHSCPHQGQMPKICFRESGDNQRALTLSGGVYDFKSADISESSVPIGRRIQCRQRKKSFFGKTLQKMSRRLKHPLTENEKVAKIFGGSQMLL